MRRVSLMLFSILMLACSTSTSPSASSSPVYFGTPDPSITDPTPVPTPGRPTSNPTILPTNAPLPQPASTSCTASANGAEPDPKCTPGVIDPTKTVSVICAFGYTTKTIRPPVEYTNSLKIKQIALYHYSDTNPTHYEEDHRVPLELGGDPYDVHNLWPEPRSGTYTAAQKDNLENYLHKQVCSGKLALPEAQQVFLGDFETWAQQHGI